MTVRSSPAGQDGLDEAELAEAALERVELFLADPPRVGRIRVEVVERDEFDRQGRGGMSGSNHAIKRDIRNNGCLFASGATSGGPGRPYGAAFRVQITWLAKAAGGLVEEGGLVNEDGARRRQGQTQDDSIQVPLRLGSLRHRPLSELRW